MPKTFPVQLTGYPQPLHHVTVVRRFQDLPASFTARVLLLRQPDGSVEAYLPFLKYQRALRRFSRSWQDNTARALGLFWDFCIVHAQQGWSPRELFREFAMTLLEGTPLIDAEPSQTDFRAARTLMWPPTPRTRVLGLIRSIEAFAEWCATETGKDGPLARQENVSIPTSGNGITNLLVWSRLRQLSMLQHLKKAPRKTAKQSVVALDRSDGKSKEMQRAKHFPPAQAERLLWEGHRRPGAATESNIFLRYNVRDMMITLLDGWGGLRRSEGLHLWVRDVIEDPSSPGHALVVLAHPEESPMEYVDPLSGTVHKTTRSETLQRIYGLRARNIVKRGSYHVGWKGMALNYEYRAQLFWIDPQAAALFWVLYQGYIRFIRPAIMARRHVMGGGDHPFLFVSEETSARTRLPGEPYSEKAYQRHHAAAVRRIGLEHAKEFGTTTHGLRHLYGQTLADLTVAPEVIRQAMHHVSVLSHLVYTAPLPAKVNAALQKAQDDTRARHRIVAPFTSDTAAELLRLRQAVDHGGFP